MILHWEFGALFGTIFGTLFGTRVNWGLRRPPKDVSREFLQIWDPFAAVCRDVYCPAEFDLTSFTCLDGGGVNGSIYDEEPITVLPSSSVELTFTILVVDTAIPAPPPP